jgi:GntR family transcriptional regulator/MocR family aminotransferase
MLLAIHLDRASREPLYRQIESQLRASIVDGRLRAGTLLPGVRTLARQLGVARITIVTAYEQLTAEGLLDARVGSGTRVTAASTDPAPIGAAANGTVRPSAKRRPLHRVWPPPGREPLGLIPGTRWIDLRPGALPGEPASASAWEGALRAAWRELARAGGSVSAAVEADPAGDLGLRALIAARIGATRGIRCTSDEVVITGGRGAAIAALAEVLVPPGRRSTAVIEDPADPRAGAAFEHAGARLVPVPVDARGLRTDLLPTSAAVVRVTPAWQERAGASLSLDRRLDLLGWASRTGATIVEDDTGAELRLQGTPPPALRSMDPSVDVVVVDALEDVLLPGLGIAVIVAPRPVAARLAERLEPQGRCAALLAQRALARMLEDGHVDRQLRRLRVGLAERQGALVRAVQVHGEGLLRAAAAPAGRHLVVTIVDPGVSARTVAARAASAGRARHAACHAPPHRRRGPRPAPRVRGRTPGSDRRGGPPHRVDVRARIGGGGPTSARGARTRPVA